MAGPPGRPASTRCARRGQTCTTPDSRGRTPRPKRLNAVRPADVLRRGAGAEANARIFNPRAAHQESCASKSDST
eukprot:5628958-Pyramimonas_sp.AAC.1